MTVDSESSKKNQNVMTFCVAVKGHSGQDIQVAVYERDGHAMIPGTEVSPEDENFMSGVIGVLSQFGIQTTNVVSFQDLQSSGTRYQAIVGSVAENIETPKNYKFVPLETAFDTVTTPEAKNAVTGLCRHYRVDAVQFNRK